LVSSLGVRSLVYSPLCFYSSSPNPRLLHSFPPRRSSDLRPRAGYDSRRLGRRRAESAFAWAHQLHFLGRHPRCSAVPIAGDWNRDRKSTRLNSSHEWISYAVFCLKKKKKYKYTQETVSEQ